MSTDVTFNPSNLPAHVRAEEGVSNEFAAGIGAGGLRLPVLSIRGKEFRFRDGGNETSTRSRDISVVLLAARPHVSKRWYAGAYESGSTDIPDCYSTDGVVPDPTALSPQAERCSVCPRNQFGSKITPSGKKAKECADYKRMVVLPVFDNQVMDSPIVLDLPYTSLKKKRDDRSDYQFLAEYTGQLARHGILAFAVVTRLSFTDAEYPQVSFAVERYVSEEEFARIIELRESDVVQDALADAQEGPGPIVEEAQPEIPPPPAHAKVASSAPPAHGKVATPAPSAHGKAASPATRATPAPLAAEPEAAKAEDDALDEDSLMDEVRKLLGGAS